MISFNPEMRLDVVAARFSSEKKAQKACNVKVFRTRVRKRQHKGN